MILARVRRTLGERQLLGDDRGVLVGCSGGPDSMALVHVLARLASELELRLTVASVDHGLRPEAADEVRAVGEFANELGLPFDALKVEVAKGPSLQAQAREARYAALLACARRRDVSLVAVGHTLDDQAETVLERLLRGSSTRGLAGIAPRREDGVIRPLLDCRRSAVHAYARRHGLAPADDPSNLDPRYLRVRVRERVLPVLEAEDPRIWQHLSDLADDARANRDLIEELARAVQVRAQSADDLDAEVLRAAPRSVRRSLLARWAHARAGATPGRAVVVALEDLLRGRGEVLLSGGLRVILREGRLTAAPQEPEV